MAARENQGYLIAVILLVLLSVILAISTYFGFTGLSEVSDRRQDLQNQYDKEKNASTAYKQQADILKAYLGLSGYSVAEVSTMLQTLQMTEQDSIITETQSIAEKYNTDMARYISKPEGEDGTWLGLVNDFANAMKANYAMIQVQNNSIERAETKRETDLASKEKEIQAKDEQLQSARADLADEKTRHIKTQTELESKYNIAEADIKRLLDVERTLKDGRTNDKKQFDAELAARLETINALKARLKKYETIQTDVADGQVISVSPILGKVYINLGYDDNLVPQQTFSVYDQQDTSFEFGKEKAKIEVTKVVSPHMAEARIVAQDLISPILTNDFVLTSVWDPGYAVPIAIVGEVDMDGDGQSDLQRLISIVQRNGGTVVAYYNEEGQVIGSIDEKTRYFVKGKEPSDAKTADGFSQLDEQRRKFEVQAISVRELLNSMGYTSEAKIQRMEKDTGPIRFAPRKPPEEDGSAFDQDN